MDDVSTTATTAAASARAGARAWWGLGLLALPLFVLALDASVLYLAAPHIAADLEPSPSQWLWAIDVYGFMIAGLLVTMGALGDRIGRRRLLVLGSLAFAGASTLAAFASEPEILILARALLGVAGATLMPSTLALIRTLFVDDRRRATAIAVWMTTFSVGIALGPLIGGVLLEAFWWGSVFLIAVPVMLLAAALAPVLLPESRDPSPPRTDLLSVALSVTAVVGLVFAMKEVVSQGWTGTSATTLVVGAAAAVTFVRRQRRIDDPLVDPALLRSRPLRVSLAVLLVAILIVTSISFLVPQFLQSVVGLGPLEAGLLTMPVAAASIVGSLLAPAVAARFGTGTVIAGGSSLAVLGYLLVAQGSGDEVWWVVGGAAVVALGISPTPVLTTDLVVRSAPPERAGSAAALSETSGELGVALGVAVMGTLLTGLYRATLTLPAWTPAEVEEATRLGLPQLDRLEPSQPAWEAAVAAFGSAFSGVAYLSAVATLALGLVARRRLRGEDDPAPPTGPGAGPTRSRTGRSRRSPARER